jgi:THO complex subunit 5
MMNRLQHELQSRQDLLKQLEELTKQKTTLETSNQQKKSFLQSLRENLKSYDAINKKINSFMQTEDQNTNDFDTARVLPTPLYVLYNNLLAYQTHFDKTINLRLVGDVKEGREALMSLITNKVDTSIYEQEEEEEDKPEKSTVESPMEDDEVVIEPPKKKIRESVEVSINDSRFKVFPISILLEIPVQHKGKHLI